VVGAGTAGDGAHAVGDEVDTQCIELIESAVATVSKTKE